jgi:voltage-gated potassium channel
MHRVRTALFWALGLNLLFGTGYYFAERGIQDGLTFLDSLWWAMVTMTTVGYGDLYPQSTIGRFFIAYPCFLVGIGLLGYLLATITETMLERVSRKRKGAMTITDKDHIIICNFPNMEKTLRLLDELEAADQNSTIKVVLITDAFDELPETLQKRGVLFVNGRPTSEEVLKQANLIQSAGVFILPTVPGDPASDSITYAIGSIIEIIENEIGSPIKTVAELVSASNLKMMQRSNVDGIILSGGISELMIVQEFLNPGIQKTFEQLFTTREGSQFYIYPSSLDNVKFVDLQIAALNHDNNLQVIGIVKDGKHLLNPSKQISVHKGDQLIILADKREDFHSIETDIIREQSA